MKEPGPKDPVFLFEADNGVVAELFRKEAYVAKLLVQDIHKPLGCYFQGRYNRERQEG